MNLEVIPKLTGHVIQSEAKGLDLNTRFFAVFTAQNDTPERFRNRF